jgi:hypothetical protein
MQLLLIINNIKASDVNYFTENKMNIKNLEQDVVWFKFEYLVDYVMLHIQMFSLNSEDLIGVFYTKYSIRSW